ncbi:MAG: hypothetical protein WBF33_21290 [Candidatus Nitrosopolaris sp.]
MVPVIKMKKRPSNVHQYKILIVNDEPDITLTLKNGPEENGFSVDAFNDPKAALSKFKAAYYTTLLRSCCVIYDWGPANIRHL